MSVKVQSHDIVAELHRLASELQRAPTRDEWVRLSRIPKDQVTAYFGTFAAALIAAGLERRKAKQKASDLFKAPLPPAPVPKPGHVVPQAKSSSAKKILVLGDTHFPWVNADALCAVYAFAEQNPDIDAVVQIGDLYDLFSWAKFPRSHLLLNPGEEIERGRKMAEEMWATLHRLLPHASLHQIKGNHDVRPLARCLEKVPELEPFIVFDRFFEFQNVQTTHDPRQPLELGGVWFIHGYLGRLGDHARKHLRSIVCGHTHKGGVVTIPLASGGALFELNAGFLGDQHAKPMSYTPTRMNEWTLGFAVIDEWGPRFIPLGPR